MDFRVDRSTSLSYHVDRMFFTSHVIKSSIDVWF